MESKPIYYYETNNSSISIICYGRVSGKAARNGSSGKSVETEAPNTNYKPAFEGQTRIQGIKLLHLLMLKKLQKVCQSLGV